MTDKQREGNNPPTTGADNERWSSGQGANSDKWLPRTPSDPGGQRKYLRRSVSQASTTAPLQQGFLCTPPQQICDRWPTNECDGRSQSRQRVFAQLLIRNDVTATNSISRVITGVRARRRWWRSTADRVPIGKPGDQAVQGTNS